MIWRHLWLRSHVDFKSLHLGHSDLVISVTARLRSRSRLWLGTLWKERTVRGEAIKRVDSRPARLHLFHDAKLSLLKLCLLSNIGHSIFFQISQSRWASYNLLQRKTQSRILNNCRPRDPGTTEHLRWDLTKLRKLDVCIISFPVLLIGTFLNSQTHN